MAAYTQVNPIVEQVKATLNSVGFMDRNLVDGYSFTSFSRERTEETSVLCAGFQRFPHTTVTACVGITSVPGLYDVKKFSYLGAPRLINIRSDGGLDLHIVKVFDKSKTISFNNLDDLSEYIYREPEIWRPESIIRAKNVSIQSINGVRDVYDVGVPLENDRLIEKKLQEMIVRILRRGPPSTNLQYKDVFHSLFEIIIAKYIIDSQTTKIAKSMSLQDAIAFLPLHRQENLAEQIKDGMPLDSMWLELADSFSLKNISVQHLVHVYENTLVDKSARKRLGIHATPYELANIIVNSMPFENFSYIPKIFEPFCGHAPFLTAAANKLTMLLSDRGGDYLSLYTSVYSNLRGVEIDAFSAEIARYALFLSSSPIEISGNIDNGDAFSENYDSTMKDSDVVFCNPPYETIFDAGTASGSKASRAIQA